MRHSFKKIFLVIAIILIVLFTVYKSASLLAPGSYPYAETYELNAPEENVIHAADLFKTDHPGLIPPKIQILNNGQFDLNDGRNDSSDLWYSIYFYFPEENQIIYT